MSTVPDDAWRDAGLEGVEDTTSLVEEVASPQDVPEETEEYRPRTSRPDLDGEANEADVVEQSQVVPELGEDPEDPGYE
jgi:hypothetical protein